MTSGERCGFTGCVERRYSISTFTPAAQLASQADAAPFVGPAAGAASEHPTCTGVTPAAVRSGRVCVRRGGWRAAVRSAPSRAARLRRSVLGERWFLAFQECSDGAVLATGDSRDVHMSNVLKAAEFTRPRAVVDLSGHVSRYAI